MDPIYESYLNEANGTPLYTIEMETSSGNYFYITVGKKPSGSIYYVMKAERGGMTHSIDNLQLKKSPPTRFSGNLEKDLKAAFSSSTSAKMLDIYPYDKFA